MAAIQLNLYVEAGATFERTLTYTNDDGSLFDLTDYTGELQVRESVSSAEATLTVTPVLNPTLGTVSWTFTAEQTSALTASNYVYALELYGPEGYVIRLLEGAVTVSPEVVR